MEFIYTELLAPRASISTGEECTIEGLEAKFREIETRLEKLDEAEIEKKESIQKPIQEVLREALKIFDELWENEETQKDGDFRETLQLCLEKIKRIIEKKKIDSLKWYIEVILKKIDGYEIDNFETIFIKGFFSVLYTDYFEDYMNDGLSMGHYHNAKKEEFYDSVVRIFNHIWWKKEENQKNRDFRERAKEIMEEVKEELEKMEKKQEEIKEEIEEMKKRGEIIREALLKEMIEMNKIPLKWMINEICIMLGKIKSYEFDTFETGIKAAFDDCNASVFEMHVDSIFDTLWKNKDDQRNLNWKEKVKKTMKEVSEKIRKKKKETAEKEGSGESLEELQRSIFLTTIDYILACKLNQIKECERQSKKTTAESVLTI